MHSFTTITYSPSFSNIKIKQIYTTTNIIITISQSHHYHHYHHHYHQSDNHHYQTKWHQLLQPIRWDHKNQRSTTRAIRVSGQWTKYWHLKIIMRNRRRWEETMKRRWGDNEETIKNDEETWGREGNKRGRETIWKNIHLKCNRLLGILGRGFTCLIGMQSEVREGGERKSEWP